MVKEASVTSARRWGLPDDAFEQRRPLRGQITKREVRAVSLYLLGLKHDGVVWDIGAGTGSVAIEASLIARDGEVYAVERDENSIVFLRNNVERWGSGNIRIIVGEAPAILAELGDYKDSVDRRVTAGGTSATSVMAQIAEIERRLHMSPTE